MKALLKRMLMIGFIFFSFHSIAQNNSPDVNSFEAAIIENTNDVVDVRFQKDQDLVLFFSIKDQKGKVLFERKIKKHNLVSTKYDISAFPDSNYLFEIVCNGTVISKIVAKGKAKIVSKEDLLVNEPGKKIILGAAAQLPDSGIQNF